MLYLNVEEYKNRGGKLEIPPYIFETIQDIIDDLTFNRIVYIGYDNLTDFQNVCL